VVRRLRWACTPTAGSNGEADVGDTTLDRDVAQRSRMAIGDVVAGLGVVCDRVPEGEQFTFNITDCTKVRELGFRAIETLMRESELRVQLALAGFSEPAVEESIQAARTWATSITTSRQGA